MNFVGKTKKLLRGVGELQRDLLFRLTGKVPAFPAEKPGQDTLRTIVYHGVVPEHPYRFNTRFISCALFEQHLKLLSKHCNLVTFEDHLQGKYATGRLNVLITFDDGYRNNATFALPILRKYKAPAVFFVTARRGPQWLFNDVLDVFATIGPKKVSVNEKKFRRVTKGIHQRYADAEGRLMQSVFQALLPEEREVVLKEIFEIVPRERFSEYSNYLGLLDFNELKELDAGPTYTIGAHGASHVDLTLVPLPILQQEMDLSRTAVVDVTNKPSAAIAFPYGKYNEEVVLAGQRSGFRYFFGAEVNGTPGGKIIPRLQINPFVSAVNELYYIYRGSHE